jgi:hypothetical protein
MEESFVKGASAQGTMGRLPGFDKKFLFWYWIFRRAGGLFLKVRSADGLFDL